MSCSLPLKVLLVDDEPLLVDLLCFEFELNHFKTYCAFGGHQALQIAQNERIDVIVSDVRMPQGDGIELLKNAMKLKNPPKVFLVSGFTDVTTEQAKELGAIGVYSKPYIAEKIVTDVLAIVQKT